MANKEIRAKETPSCGWVRQAAIELTVLGRRYLVAMRTTEDALNSEPVAEKRHQPQSS